MNMIRLAKTFFAITINNYKKYFYFLDEDKENLATRNTHTLNPEEPETLAKIIGKDGMLLCIEIRPGIRIYNRN